MTKSIQVTKGRKYFPREPHVGQPCSVRSTRAPRTLLSRGSSAPSSCAVSTKLNACIYKCKQVGQLIF